jgi:hypothetical protein
MSTRQCLLDAVLGLGNTQSLMDAGFTAKMGSEQQF